MARFLWTERTNFGPSARMASAMTFDSSRNCTVLFGGDSDINGIHGDTWEWDGSFWTQVEDIGPSPRSLSALAFDIANKVSILFGGLTSTAATGDTWQWDGSNWTKLSESGPAGRGGHAMVFDSNRNRMVLFGGHAGNTLFADTWEFDGESWTQQQDTGPSARSGHAMAFDAANKRVVLFGGAGADLNGLGDTWAWDGQEWMQIAEFGPVGRLRAPMVSVGAATMILYGGATSLANVATSVALADSWQFDGKLWTQVQDIGPGPLLGAGMAFDSNRGAVVLFGGVSTVTGDGIVGFFFGDTWESSVTPVAVAPPAAIAVASLSVAADAGIKVPIPVTITLTGISNVPTIVSFSGPIFNSEGQNLPPVSIPAGMISFVVNAEFVTPFPGIPGEQTFSAQTEGTPPVSASVHVLP